MKNIPSAGKYLVAVCLVPDIPYNLVVRCIENIMKGNSQFNHSQAGSKMARIVTDGINDKIA